jgi:hypothetical protein
VRCKLSVCNRLKGDWNRTVLDRLRLLSAYTRLLGQYVDSRGCSRGQFLLSSRMGPQERGPEQGTQYAPRDVALVTVTCSLELSLQVIVIDIVLLRRRARVRRQWRSIGEKPICL